MTASQVLKPLPPRTDRTPYVVWMSIIWAAMFAGTIRGLKTEVLLTEEDGMPAACAVNFDHISLGQRDRFGSVLCSLSGERWPEVRRALLIACGFHEE